MLISEPSRRLPPALVDAQAAMLTHATDYGLDVFPTIFELVTADELHAIAAYGGFPTRYPHWRFGMEYQQLSRSYSYGLQKIYELVINNDPCYAYLLDSNALTDHKLVMAHVYGHCDFFKNNAWFGPTNRHMIDEMANHGQRVRRQMRRHGVEAVETFIDVCLSVEDLIDVHAPLIPPRTGSDEDSPATDDAETPVPKRAPRFASRDYLQPFVNPAERLREADMRLATPSPPIKVPAEPTRDVLGFLLTHAPLKTWEADVLSIVRDEAIYFAPQGQTKIMNEGWATFWHSTIMTRHGLEPDDVISYADHTSGTLAHSPRRLNPYKLGLELFRDIEDRWNRGCFGQDYDDCDDHQTRRRWNTRAGLGRQKIFEVRAHHNDVTFIDEFLTLEFCREHNFFAFGYNEIEEHDEIVSRRFEDIKRQLLFSLTNLGRPIIRVIDGNYKNRSELLLEHQFPEVELRRSYAAGTLANLQRLWKRPVHLKTRVDDRDVIYSHDGAEFEESRRSVPPLQRPR